MIGDHESVVFFFELLKSFDRAARFVSWVSGFFKNRFKDDTEDLFGDFTPGGKLEEQEPTEEEIKIQEREAASNQIDDILKVTKALKEGEISKVGAMTLLINIGVDQYKASGIIEGIEQPAEPASQPDPQPPADPLPEIPKSDNEQLAKIKEAVKDWPGSEKLALYIYDKMNE